MQGSWIFWLPRQFLIFWVMPHLLLTRLGLSWFKFQNYFAKKEWNLTVGPLWLRTDLKSSLRFLIHVIGVVALYFAKEDWMDKWSNPDSCINSDQPICSWICSSIQAHSSSNCALLNPCCVWFTGESIWILLNRFASKYWTLITI